VSVGWYARSRATRLGLATSILGLALLTGAPAATAAAAITLTTPFPAIVVAPGSSPSFDVSITTANPGRVTLSVGKVPAGWTAVMRGGGFTIDGLESPGGSAVTKVTLNVTVPADAAAGTQLIDVAGTTPGGSTTLHTTIRVEPNAAGQVTLTTDTPQLKGASNTSFSFSLTLTNDTADDLPFSATSTGPDGWTVTPQVGSTAQAASVVVKAGATTPVTVTAKASTDAAAGTYPIGVDVTSGSRSAHQDLSVEITGSYTLSLSTSDQRLNMNATAGSTSDVTLALQNTGTADVAAAAMSATGPTGWKFTFDPATVDVRAGQTVSVIAHVQPSSDAIAGDYQATFKATAPVADASTDIRVTIETSLLWGLIGVGLIALVLIGLLLTFRRFGRR
jgi:uncharacterized membrane protein